MSFSPQFFLSNLNSKRGPAKSNRYEVIIPIPTYLNNFITNSIIMELNLDSNTSIGDLIARIQLIRSQSDPGFGLFVSRFLALQCEATELPGKMLQTADVKIYGPTFKVPYQAQFQDLTLTFLCTNEFYERKLFDKWLEVIMPMDTNNLRYPKGDDTRYMTNIRIIQYDEFIKEIYAIECLDAFPIGISSQPVAWANDNFHRVSVVFAYQKHRTIYNGSYNIDEMISSIIGNIDLTYLQL
jgi:hypothetical protein